jgi:hypothetical protein
MIYALSCFGLDCRRVTTFTLPISILIGEFGDFRLVHVVRLFSSMDEMMKVRYLFMIQINDLWTLDGDT